jgi:acyl carrier protein
MSTDIPEKNEIQVALLDFLCRQFYVDLDDIILDKSLIDTGIIDSMGLIEIASYIKISHGFTVTQEQMNRENFGSVVRIVDFIFNNTNHF